MNVPASDIQPPRSRCAAPLARMATVAVCVLLPALAAAQAVYRSVGPGGRIVFTDQPSDATRSGAAAIGAPAAPASASGGTGQLPYELRQAAQRYPVTLYTTVGCAPCNSARVLLQTRGIPFAERTVNNAQDAAALQALSRDTALPLLTIGAQQLKGFLESDWQQYLSAAGYPAQSHLPVGYRTPAPTPLAEASQAGASTAGAPADQQPSAAPNVPADAPTDNPAGIVF